MNLNKNLFACLAVSLLTVFLISGCSDAPEGEDAGKTEEQLNTTTSKEDLKQRLEDIAETGVAGSALAGMRDSLEELKSSDPSVDEEMLSLLDQLESANAESKVKSIAQKMADKLE